MRQSDLNVSNSCFLNNDFAGYGTVEVLDQSTLQIDKIYLTGDTSDLYCQQQIPSHDAGQRDTLHSRQGRHLPGLNLRGMAGFPFCPERSDLCWGSGGAFLRGGDAVAADPGRVGSFDPHQRCGGTPLRLSMVVSHRFGLTRSGGRCMVWRVVLIVTSHKR